MTLQGTQKQQAPKTSTSGRVLSPKPRVDLTTERKSQNSVRRIHAWVRREALLETRHRGDRWAELLIEATDPKNLSAADIEHFNTVLFDREYPWDAPKTQN